MLVFCNYLFSLVCNFYVYLQSFVARLSENEDILFQPKIVEQLQLVADKNDIARFRIFEVKQLDSIYF